MPDPGAVSLRAQAGAGHIAPGLGPSLGTQCWRYTRLCLLQVPGCAQQLWGCWAPSALLW